MTGPEVIAEIQAALDAGPTPGAWSHDHRKGRDGMHNTEVFDLTGKTIAMLAWHVRPTVNGVTGTHRGANAAYIAACSPANIAALLAHIKDLEERLQRSQGAHMVCTDRLLATEDERDETVKALEAERDAADKRCREMQAMCTSLQNELADRAAGGGGG